MNSIARGSVDAVGSARSHGSDAFSGSHRGTDTSTSDSPTTQSSVCGRVTWK